MTIPSNKEYELVIIGAGFAGLTAAMLASQRGLDFCVVAEGAGASRHFSGAFDIGDGRFAPDENPFDSKDQQQSFAQFMQKYPRHLYARFAETPAFRDDFFRTAAAFFAFYGIPCRGDGTAMLAVAGSTGELKPTAFALPSHALVEDNLRSGTAVAYVTVPGLPDYPEFIIGRNLSRRFSRTVSVVWTPEQINLTSPLASLALRFDRDEKTLAVFVEFLKSRIGSADLVLIPPFLGLHRHAEVHAELEKRVGIPVRELLSVTPSISGLRLEAMLSKSMVSRQVPLLRGIVTGYSVDSSSLRRLEIRSLQESQSDRALLLNARNVILATGKFLGGGVTHQEKFRETVFNLPLYSGDRVLTPATHVTSMVRPEAVERQPFLALGVEVDAQMRPLRDGRPAFSNLKACGQVLGGFDFTRERSGFGVSVASALKCF